MTSACDQAEIFYLDDMEDEIVITQLHLRRESLDLEVRYFVDGRDLTAALEERLDEGDAPPDLVVVDFNMPGKSGIQLIETMRRDARCHDVVMGVCTGSDNPADETAASEGGADFYVVKPFDRTAILDICQTTRRFELVRHDDDRERLHRHPAAADGDTRESGHAGERGRGGGIRTHECRDQNPVP